VLLLHLLLLLLTIGLALYDWKTCRVPNRVTLLLLSGGLILHFPGALETWLGCLLLYSAWRLCALGGGDAKLWMALLWLTPPGLAGKSLLLMAGMLALSALLQLAYRALRRCRLTGVQSPGAWRAIPFAFWLAAVGS
jgi:Flp pilus assembly protein protease CpaA